MTVRELAEIYTDLVRMEEAVPEEEWRAKEGLNALRTKYHELLMERMRAENVDFSDRFDAAQQAFEMVQAQ